VALRGVLNCAFYLVENSIEPVMVVVDRPVHGKSALAIFFGACCAIIEGHWGASVAADVRADTLPEVFEGADVCISNVDLSIVSGKVESFTWRSHTEVETTLRTIDQVGMGAVVVVLVLGAGGRGVAAIELEDALLYLGNNASSPTAAAGFMTAALVEAKKAVNSKADARNAITSDLLMRCDIGGMRKAWERAWKACCNGDDRYRVEVFGAYEETAIAMVFIIDTECRRLERWFRRRWCGIEGLDTELW
jgi:hypothetical protein